MKGDVHCVVRPFASGLECASSPAGPIEPPTYKFLGGSCFTVNYLSGSNLVKTISYDGAGNQTNTSMGTANAVNEYSNFTYNPRGDLTDDGTYAYTWNAADQLVAVTAHGNSVKVTFQWDGEGRCIEKDVYTSNDGEDDGAAAWTLSYARKFVYDGTQLVEELDGNGNPVTGYTWGPQGLLAVTDFTGGAKTVYMAELDGQSNVVGLVNAETGQVAATYTYSPYGALLTATGPAQGVDDVLAKQGLTVREVKLNLFSVRFENWDGVWIQRDPAGIAGGSNLFEYCGNDPVNWSDSTGKHRKQNTENRTQLDSYSR